LGPTFFLDSDHDSIRRFALSVGGSGTDVEKAVRLFNAVRDGVRYDPYAMSFAPEDFKASTTLKRKLGFCVSKAILLAAAARAVGVPSRLGFADVRNHLTTRKLREGMGTDVFVFHGFVLFFLEGRWIKATPAFNRTLCEKFGVKTLGFDGVNDALFHPFDKSGRKHMEYIRDRGEFGDFPFEQWKQGIREAYPHIVELLGSAPLEGDFEKEAALEKTGEARLDDPQK